MATIAVEMPVASASPERAEALLRACTIAAAPDRCEAADETLEPPTAFAVVTWQGELAVRIEIGRPGSEDWLERRMTFAPEDPVAERWQAIGFAIGTLFGAARGHVGPASPEATAALPAETADDTERPVARKHARAAPPAHTVQLGLLGRAGTGTESSARFGGGVALVARHAAGPFAALDFNLDWADVSLASPEVALSARFVSVGASIGTALTLSQRLRLDLAAGPLLEYQWIATADADSPQSRPVGAVRANVTLSHRFGARFWLGIGAQMGSRFGDTTIAIDSERVDTIPLVFATGYLALSFDLWRRLDNAR